MKKSELKAIIREVIEESKHNYFEEEITNEDKNTKLQEICDKLSDHVDTRGMCPWFIDEGQPNTIIHIRWKGQSYSKEIRETILELGYPKPKKIEKIPGDNDHWYYVTFNDNVYNTIEESQLHEEQVFQVRVTFDDGDYLQTRINGKTEDDVKDYYSIGSTLNVGSGPNDNIKTITKVEIL